MREWLLPWAAEGDQQFRQEITRDSRLGLRALGAVEAALCVLLLPRIVPSAALIALGIATWCIARALQDLWPMRTAAFVSSIGAIALLRSASGDAVLAGAMVIQAAAVVAIPLWPVQALALGSAAALLCHWTAPGHDLFLAVLTILSCGIAGALYRGLHKEHLSRQKSRRIADALAGAKLRAQLVENATSVGKLAAAVTHEINTPLGSLSSAVDTLLALAAKQAGPAPMPPERFATLQADLRRSIQISMDRIRAVVARLQRFISLDEAELQPANINDLISDVAILFREQVERGIKLEFSFQPVPALMCRPQLLTTVLSSLLSNAFNAANGEGRILVSTRKCGEMVEIEIEDNGRGMAPEEIETVFDPGFKNSGGRMTSGNWSLFNSRQIVFEHGGDIRIHSVAGKGTTVWVSLPAN